MWLVTVNLHRAHCFGEREVRSQCALSTYLSSSPGPETLGRARQLLHLGLTLELKDEKVWLSHSLQKELQSHVSNGAVLTAEKGSRRIFSASWLARVVNLHIHLSQRQWAAWSCYQRRNLTGLECDRRKLLAQASEIEAPAPLINVFSGLSGGRGNKITAVTFFQGFFGWWKQAPPSPLVEATLFIAVVSLCGKVVRDRMV